MLDTLDSRVGRLLDRDTDRDVTGKRQTYLSSFVRDGEVRVARRMVVHLDEIDAVSFEVSDGFPCVLSVGNAAPERPVWWRIVEDRSRRNDLGPEQFAAVDAVSERKDEFNV